MPKNIEDILVDAVPSNKGEMRDFFQQGMPYNVLRHIPYALHASILDSTNTTSLHSYINDAIAEAASEKRDLGFPRGQYVITAQIGHATSNLRTAYARNGLKLVALDGAGSVEIKAITGFPTTATAMLYFNGNAAATEDLSNVTGPVAQYYSGVYGLVFNGNSIADRIIQMRALEEFEFSNFWLKNCAGASTDGALHITGVTTPTKDDADTTGSGTIRDGFILTGTGNGILAVDSRFSNVVFKRIQVRSFSYDGARFAAAEATFEQCLFALNGTNGATRGGATIVRPTTEADTRAVRFINCQFEADYGHEVHFEHCQGGGITGGTCSPYVHDGGDSDGHALFKFGKTASREARCISVKGLRIRPYSDTATPSYTDLPAFDVGQYAREIDIDNNAVDATFFGTRPKQIIAHASATGFYNKVRFSTSATDIRPSFCVRLAPNATPHANITGNGALFRTNGVNGVFDVVPIAVDWNNGGLIDTSTTSDGGRILVPCSGILDVRLVWPITGFDTGMHTAEVGVEVDTAVNFSRRITYHLSSLSSTHVECFEFHREIEVVEGDVVNGYIQIVGGAGDNADLLLADPNQFLFQGRML